MPVGALQAPHPTHDPSQGRSSRARTVTRPHCGAAESAEAGIMMLRCLCHRDRGRPGCQCSPYASGGPPGRQRLVGFDGQCTK